MNIDLKNIWQKIKSYNRRKALLYLLFISLSFGVWFIIKLSNDYGTQMQLSLQYHNLPKGLVWVSEPPQKLNVSIQGRGNKLLAYKYNYEDLSVDLSRIQQIRRQWYISINKQISKLRRQLNENNIRLQYIDADTLWFQIDSITHKRVKIIPHIDYDFEDGFVLKDSLLLTPNTVEISGPKKHLDTLQQITTADIKINAISENISISIPLVKIPLIHPNISEVTLKINIDRVTEEIISVPIDVIFENNISTDIKTFPKKIKLLCKGPLNIVNKISINDIRVTLDYEKYIDHPDQYKPRINCTVKGVEIKNIDTEQIEVIIK